MKVITEIAVLAAINSVAFASWCLRFLLSFFGIHALHRDDDDPLASPLVKGA